MTINLQLIMKNHPVIRIRISKAKIAKPNARLIMIENKSPKQRFMSDHIGNILVCEIMTHCFFFVLFVICLLRYYVYIFYVTRTILGLTFLHPDTNIYADSYSYSYSYAYQRHLLSLCRLL